MRRRRREGRDRVCCSILWGGARVGSVGAEAMEWGGWREMKVLE